MRTVTLSAIALSITTLGFADSATAQQARKLLKPEEVITLPPRCAITFTPGVPPVFTTLLRYYEEKHLGKWSSPFWRFFVR